jgi:hypothetical protein
MPFTSLSANSVVCRRNPQTGSVGGRSVCSLPKPAKMVLPNSTAPDEFSVGEDTDSVVPAERLVGGELLDVAVATAASGGWSTRRSWPRWPFCQVTETPFAGGAGGVSSSGTIALAEGCGVGGGGCRVGRGGSGGGGASVFRDSKVAPQARQNRAVSTTCVPQFGQNFIYGYFGVVFRTPRRTGHPGR